MSNLHRSMSIHRSRAQPRRTSSIDSLADAGAVLTVVQVCFCIVMLVAVFTMQFLDTARYQQAGELYKAVMGSPFEEDDTTGEAMFVGAFGTPITRELLEDYATELMDTLPRGGESPYVPSNIYSGSLAITARPLYPVYGLVTSLYGGRSHPISRRLDYHTGLDIAAPAGANIYAALPGTVTEVGYSDTYGNYIKLSHGNRLATVYNHCSEILATEGAVLRQGERIALVGSTGVSTGPHLHFDVLVDGGYTDPLPLLMPWRVSTDG